MGGALDNGVGRAGEAGEDGSVILLAAILLPLIVLFAAFVIDIGAAFVMKRHLQKAADAAALAAAQDLYDGTATDLTAHDYSGEPAGRNEITSLPTVTTTVECSLDGETFASCPTFPSGANKVRVTQSAASPLFFASIVPGFDGFEVEASAVASRLSTTTGTPLAIYVHELCGASTGNKGLIINGEDARVEGGIHVNGHLEIGGARFTSVGAATVYRPPPQGTSEAGPTQGPDCKTTDTGDSVYCTGCAEGQTTDPGHGPWRDWVTPYHTEAIMKSSTPCTINHSNDAVYESGPIPAGVHCVADGKKFILKPGATEGNITVIADYIELGGSARLRPYDEDHPVLFYSTNTDGTPVKMNPSGAYDWTGYIINRVGGIEVNAAGVTSPFRGLLEAEWIIANGEDFRMLGTHPDSPAGEISGGVALEE